MGMVFAKSDRNPLEILTFIISALTIVARESGRDIPEFIDQSHEAEWWGSIDGRKAIFELADLEYDGIEVD